MELLEKQRRGAMKMCFGFQLTALCLISSSFLLGLAIQEDLGEWSTWPECDQFGLRQNNDVTVASNRSRLCKMNGHFDSKDSKENRIGIRPCEHWANCSKTASPVKDKDHHVIAKDETTSLSTKTQRLRGYSNSTSTDVRGRRSFATNAQSGKDSRQPRAADLLSLFDDQPTHSGNAKFTPRDSNHNDFLQLLNLAGKKNLVGNKDKISQDLDSLKNLFNMISKDDNTEDHIGQIESLLQLAGTTMPQKVQVTVPRTSSPPTLSLETTAKSPTAASVIGARTTTGVTSEITPTVEIEVTSKPTLSSTTLATSLPWETSETLVTTGGKTTLAELPSTVGSTFSRETVSKLTETRKIETASHEKTTIPRTPPAKKITENATAWAETSAMEMTTLSSSVSLLGQATAQPERDLGEFRSPAMTEETTVSQTTQKESLTAASFPSTELSTEFTSEKILLTSKKEETAGNETYLSQTTESTTERPEGQSIELLTENLNTHVPSAQLSTQSVKTTIIHPRMQSTEADFLKIFDDTMADVGKIHPKANPQDLQDLGDLIDAAKEIMDNRELAQHLDTLDDLVKIGEKPPATSASATAPAPTQPEQGLVEFTSPSVTERTTLSQTTPAVTRGTTASQTVPEEIQTSASYPSTKVSTGFTSEQITGEMMTTLRGEEEEAEQVTREEIVTHPSETTEFTSERPTEEREEFRTEQIKTSFPELSTESVKMTTIGSLIQSTEADFLKLFDDTMGEVGEIHPKANPQDLQDLGDLINAAKETVDGQELAQHLDTLGGLVKLGEKLPTIPASATAPMPTQPEQGLVEFRSPAGTEGTTISQTIPEESQTSASFYSTKFPTEFTSEQTPGKMMTSMRKEEEKVEQFTQFEIETHPSEITTVISGRPAGEKEEFLTKEVKTPSSELTESVKTTTMHPRIQATVVDFLKLFDDTMDEVAKIHPKADPQNLKALGDLIDAAKETMDGQELAQHLDTLGGLVKLGEKLLTTFASTVAPVPTLRSEEATPKQATSSPPGTEWPPTATKRQEPEDLLKRLDSAVKEVKESPDEVNAQNLQKIDDLVKTLQQTMKEEKLFEKTKYLNETTELGRFLSTGLPTEAEVFPESTATTPAPTVHGEDLLQLIEKLGQTREGEVPDLGAVLDSIRNISGHVVSEKELTSQLDELLSIIEEKGVPTSTETMASTEATTSVAVADGAYLLDFLNKTERIDQAHLQDEFKDDLALLKHFFETSTGKPEEAIQEIFDEIGDLVNPRTTVRTTVRSTTTQTPHPTTYRSSTQAEEAALLSLIEEFEETKKAQEETNHLQVQSLEDLFSDVKESNKDVLSHEIQHLNQLLNPTTAFTSATQPPWTTVPSEATTAPLTVVTKEKVLDFVGEIARLAEKEQVVNEKEMEGINEMFERVKESDEDVLGNEIHQLLGLLLPSTVATTTSQTPSLSTTAYRTTTKMEGEALLNMIEEFGKAEKKHPEEDHLQIEGLKKLFDGVYEFNGDMLDHEINHLNQMLNPTTLAVETTEVSRPSTPGKATAVPSTEVVESKVLDFVQAMAGPARAEQLDNKEEMESISDIFGKVEESDKDVLPNEINQLLKLLMPGTLPSTTLTTPTTTTFGTVAATALVALATTAYRTTTEGGEVLLDMIDEFRKTEKEHTVEDHLQVQRLEELFGDVRESNKDVLMHEIEHLKQLLYPSTISMQTSIPATTTEATTPSLPVIATEKVLDFVDVIGELAENKTLRTGEEMENILSLFGQVPDKNGKVMNSKVQQLLNLLIPPSSTISAHTEGTPSVTQPTISEEYSTAISYPVEVEAEPTIGVTPGHANELLLDLIEALGKTKAEASKENRLEVQRLQEVLVQEGAAREDILRDELDHLKQVLGPAEHTPISTPLHPQTTSPTPWQPSGQRSQSMPTKETLVARTMPELISPEPTEIIEEGILELFGEVPKHAASDQKEIMEGVRVISDILQGANQSDATLFSNEIDRLLAIMQPREATPTAQGPILASTRSSLASPGTYAVTKVETGVAGVKGETQATAGTKYSPLMRTQPVQQTTTTATSTRIGTSESTAATEMSESKQNEALLDMLSGESLLKNKLVEDTEEIQNIADLFVNLTLTDDMLLANEIARLAQDLRPGENTTPGRQTSTESFTTPQTTSPSPLFSTEIPANETHRPSTFAPTTTKGTLPAGKEGPEQFLDLLLQLEGQAPVGISWDDIRRLSALSEGTERGSKEDLQEGLEFILSIIKESLATASTSSPTYSAASGTTINTVTPTTAELSTTTLPVTSSVAPRTIAIEESFLDTIRDLVGKVSMKLPWSEIRHIGALSKTLEETKDEKKEEIKLGYVAEIMNKVGELENRTAPTTHAPTTTTIAIPTTRARPETKTTSTTRAPLKPTTAISKETTPRITTTPSPLTARHISLSHRPSTPKPTSLRSTIPSTPLTSRQIFLSHRPSIPKPTPPPPAPSYFPLTTHHTSLPHPLSSLKPASLPPTTLSSTLTTRHISPTHRLSSPAPTSLPPTTPYAPVDRWTEWSPWGTCSSTCGPGEQSRSRDCRLFIEGLTIPSTSCEGSRAETMICQMRRCPETVRVDGQWSDWSEWSECSATCGPGKQTRYHLCDSPPPSGDDGQPCEGALMDEQDCLGEEETCEEAGVKEVVAIPPTRAPVDIKPTRQETNKVVAWAVLVVFIVVVVVIFVACFAVKVRQVYGQKQYRGGKPIFENDTLSASLRGRRSMVP